MGSLDEILSEMMCYMHFKCLYENVYSISELRHSVKTHTEDTIIFPKLLPLDKMLS